MALMATGRTVVLEGPAENVLICLVHIPNDHVRKFFGNEGADREIDMRHKFRIRSQFKHHLGSNVFKSLGLAAGY